MSTAVALSTVCCVCHVSTCCKWLVSAVCRQPSWGVSDPACRFKLVYASDDGGNSWQHVGSPGPMQWPQIFSCASGVKMLLTSPQNQTRVSTQISRRSSVTACDTSLLS